ncbi:hypothetical protein I2I05_06810 [Hymenobacter sp. BT683]|uniref:DUF304 domain-containing protein n=1 Tax=Hymenobacter jeongseonensis TaxID=2791027 RepID=A0ABS0IFG4_9BACT|nr:hypothetical protein [Hymenobacter jeongseonensis]MBF9237104.1 hypothetical protein [Hymenobacter jeongseonensis]
MKKKPRFSKKQIAYEYEIGYSQSAILFNFVFGLPLSFGSLVLAFWWQAWVFLFISAAGFFMLWRAVKMLLDQSPQLKIGYQGIWTVKTGHLPWTRVMAVMKQSIGFRGGVTEHLAIVNRFNPYIDIEQIWIDELDVDIRSLRVYLKKCASGQT